MKTKLKNDKSKLPEITPIIHWVKKGEKTPGAFWLQRNGDHRLCIPLKRVKEDLQMAITLRTYMVFPNDLNCLKRVEPGVKKVTELFKSDPFRQLRYSEAKLLSKTHDVFYCPVDLKKPIYLT